MPKLTASIYLEELGRLVIGRQNGLINIINASQALVFQLLSANGYGDKSKLETNFLNLGCLMFFSTYRFTENAYSSWP